MARLLVRMEGVMEDIKKIIEDAAKEIIDGVDGISEGTKEYEQVLKQLIRLQSLNYQANNPGVDLGVEPDPEPMVITTGIRKVAAQIEENRKLKEEEEALEEQEAIDDKEAAALRH